jgi:hypothetical protein
MATSTLTTGVPRVDPTGEHAFVIRFVFSVLEDAPLHPEGSFAVASVTILPSGRFEMAQVLKHQDARLVLFGKLDNTSAHQMGDILIDIADLTPEVDVVLLTFR